jgi:hypothetical protein
VPSDTKQAQRMLDLFTSVGATSLVVTKTDVEQKLISSQQTAHPRCKLAFYREKPPKCKK